MLSQPSILPSSEATDNEPVEAMELDNSDGSAPLLDAVKLEPAPESPESPPEITEQNLNLTEELWIENERLFKLWQEFPYVFPGLRMVCTGHSSTNVPSYTPVLIDEKGSVSVMLENCTYQVPSMITCSRCNYFMRLYVKQTTHLEQKRIYPNYRCARTGCATFRSVRKVILNPFDPFSEQFGSSKNLPDCSEGSDGPQAVQQSPEGSGGAQGPFKIVVTTDELTNVLLNCIKETLMNMTQNAIANNQ